MTKVVRYLKMTLWFLLFWGLTGNTAYAETKEIILKGVTAWPANDKVSTTQFRIFQEMVNEKLKGKLKIECLGGSEVIPSFELIHAVKNGVVDVAYLATPYYSKALPQAQVLELSQLNHKEMRKSGFYKAFNELHQKKLNSFYYANTSGEGSKLAVYLRKKIEKPDFSGLQLRASPAYVPLIKALGGVPVIIPPAEIYTALDRGLVDGVCWPSVGITEWSWHEVLTYMVDHEFLSGPTAILFNLDSWNRLPESLRKSLIDLSTKLEDNCAQFKLKQRLEYRKRYQASGLKFIKFTPEDERKFLDTIYRATKEDFLKRVPVDGPRLLELVTK